MREAGGEDLLTQLLVHCQIKVDFPAIMIDLGSTVNPFIEHIPPRRRQIHISSAIHEVDVQGRARDRINLLEDMERNNTISMPLIMLPDCL